MTSLLPAFYIGLMDAYGDDIDRAAYGLLNLISIPAVPICILSFENSGGLNYMALLASVVPFLLGMLLGNLDPAIRRLFAPAGTICLPFLGFTLGTSINLMSLSLIHIFNILTDGRIDDILDEAYVGLSEGEYAEAAFAFLENADIFMRQGRCV